MDYFLSTIDSLVANGATGTYFGRDIYGNDLGIIPQNYNATIGQVIGQRRQQLRADLARNMTSTYKRLAGSWVRVNLTGQVQRAVVLARATQPAVLKFEEIRALSHASPSGFFAKTVEAVSNLMS